MEKGRLLMVCNTFPRFSGTFIVNKFLGLIRRGWDVHIAANRPADRAQWDYFPHLPPQRVLADRLHVSTDFSAALEAAKPDIVHFEFGNLAQKRIHLRAQFDFRAVVSFRGAENVFAQDPTAPSPYAEVWPVTDAVHVLGEHIWQEALDAGCPADLPHFFIPPGINTDLFDPHDRYHHEVAGTSDRPLRVLSVGRIHWKKGYEYALQAVRLLRDAGCPVEYRIVGAGSKNDSDHFVSHAVADLGLGDCVTLTGALPSTDVREQHLWADVMLHAAVSEGFGNAVIEGQAMGTPVVCSDAGGLPENVDDGETGFVVARRSPEALAERLLELSGNPALRQTMGASGRRRVLENFSIDAHIAGFERLYRSVLDIPAKPHPQMVPAITSAVARNETRMRGLERQLDELRHATTTLRLRLRHAQEQHDRQQADERLERVRQAVLYADQIAAIRSSVSEVVPPGSVVLVATRGDGELVDFAEHVGWHFPRDPSGLYAGHHFAHGQEAVNQLEELREAGAACFVLPGAAFWWLDHYRELQVHLESRYRTLVKDELHVLYDVR